MFLEELILERKYLVIWNSCWYDIDLKMISKLASQIHHTQIHQKHPQMGKSYIGKAKIYLNDAKPEILL